MGLAAVAALTGVRPVALRIDHVNASTLLLNDGAVPLDAKGSLLLRYRGGRRTFPYVSASDVMSGHARAEEVKNRLIFVGTTALGTREVVATPLDTLFAGVEVHATVADDLLQRDFIYRPDYGVGLETQLVLAFGVAMALVGARLGLAWGAAAAARSGCTRAHHQPDPPPCGERWRWRWPRWCWRWSRRRRGWIAQERRPATYGC